MGVHTLVAENSAGISPRRDRQYPMTSSEELYIGDESIVPPPNSKKARKTFTR